MVAALNPGHAAAAAFPLRRAAVALAASMLVHLLLAGDWSGSDRAVVAVPALQARLAPAAIPDFAASVTVPVADYAAVVAGTATLGDRPPLQTSPAERPAPAAATADPRFYAARELDRFPVPLELLPGAADAGVRLWLSIDRQGAVVEVAAADPALPPPEGTAERLRALRFVPALKDGLPVNSRVLLELRGS